MNLITFFVNLSLAVLLFIINGIIGNAKLKSGYTKTYSTFEFNNIDDKNFAGNFFQAVVHPALLIAIASVILQHLSLECIAKDLWLMAPIYWGIRFLHTLLWNRFSLVNWRYEIPALISSIILSQFTLFIIVRPLIDNNKSVFIDLEQFRDAFWFAAITYLAKLFWDILKAKTTGDDLYPTKKKSAIIICRYNRFHKKYSSYIDNQLNSNYTFPNVNTQDHFKCLFYSVMIYEDHSRPTLIRGLEYISKLICWNRTFSLGIMQVQSKKLIGSKTSIDLALNILYEPFMKAEPNQRIDDAIEKYNKSEKYYDEVFAIYKELQSHLDLKPIKPRKKGSSKAKD